VRQEIWGIALAYNLVRLEMERAAEEAHVEPTQISFVNARRPDSLLLADLDDAAARAGPHPRTAARSPPPTQAPRAAAPSTKAQRSTRGEDQDEQVAPQASEDARPKLDARRCRHEITQRREKSLSERYWG